MCHHGKIVSITLQNFIMNFKPCLVRCRTTGNICNVDTIVGVSVRGLTIILIYPSADLESTFHDFLTIKVNGEFLVKCYWNLLRGKIEDLVAGSVNQLTINSTLMNDQLTLRHSMAVPA